MNRSFGLAMIVTVLTVSVAHAGDWVARNVVKRGGTIGIGTTSVGEIEDRAGNIPAELTINCSEGATTVFVTSKSTSFGRDDVPSNIPSMAKAYRKRDGISATIAIARDYGTIPVSGSSNPCSGNRRCA